MSSPNELPSDIFFKTRELLFFRLAFSAVSLCLIVGIAWFVKCAFEPSSFVASIVFVMAYSACGLALLKYKIVSSEEKNEAAERSAAEAEATTVAGADLVGSRAERSVYTAEEARVPSRRSGYRKLTILNQLLIALDIISLTGLVHTSGGIESDLYVLYLLPILLSSYTFTRKGVLITALFVSVSYVLLLVIENRTFVPYIFNSHVQGGLAQAYVQRLWQRILERSALLVSVSFIWARFCEHMSCVAQHGANRLREQLAHNTQLVSELEAQAQREKLLNSINSAVRSTLDLNQILETAVDELSKALQVKGCAIVCPQSQTGEALVIVCNSRYPTHFSYDNSTSQVDGAIKAPERKPNGNSPVTAISQEDLDDNSTGLGPYDLVFSQQICQFILNKKSSYEKSPVGGQIIKTFVFDKPAEDALFLPIKDDLKAHRLTSLVVNPMMYADQSKGILLIGEQDRGRSWSTSELDLIKSVAGQVSVAIEHAELVDELSSKNKDLLNKNLNLDAKHLELKVVQSKLIHQEKMASLGRLVAGIAHELNNPINFVHGNLPYLKDYFQELKRLIAALESLPGTDKKEIDRLRKELKYEFLVADLENIFADLNDGAERIRHIIRNLRSFSRLDEAELKEASIQEGIESTIKILSQFYGKDKIPLQCSFGVMPLVLCYPGQLNQVWMNLLSNAAAAVSAVKEPKVRLKADVEGSNVIVSISDNGSGIKPEVQSKIFEPFFTTKPIGQGTGLGLSICHSIVERHGGQIWCESKLGEGATFTVQIPIYRSPADLLSLTRDNKQDRD